MRSAPYLAPGVLRASSADIPGPSPGTEHHTSCVLFPETAFLPQPTSHPSLPNPPTQPPQPSYPSPPASRAFLPHPPNHPSLSTPAYQPPQPFYPTPPATPVSHCCYQASVSGHHLLGTGGVLHPVQSVGGREGISWNKGPYCSIWAFKPQATLSVPPGGGERLKELGPPSP